MITAMAPRARKRAAQPPAIHPVPVCTVFQVFPRAECGTTPVRPFIARCDCGHAMQGHACPACLESPKLGCERGWRLPAGRRHKCEVTVVAET